MTDGGFKVEPVEYKKFTITIRLSWWLIYVYIPLLRLTVKFHRLFNEDAEPNWDKVDKIIKFGIKVVK